MKRLVFDLEIYPENFDAMDAASQKDLTRYLRSTSESDSQYETGLTKLKTDLTFSPLTAKIIAIGVYDPDDDRGAVYYDAGDSEPEDSEQDRMKYSAMTEADMLMKFWALAEISDEFISFYGRGLDAPFLMIRSAIHHIRPTKDLMSNRYGSSGRPGAIHYDLYDLMTFYGALRRRGSLHMWCRAFGIASPKAEMDGSQVHEFYDAGKYLEIARYNAADLRATAQLFEYWQRYLKF